MKPEEQARQMIDEPQQTMWLDGIYVVGLADSARNLGPS